MTDNKPKALTQNQIKQQLAEQTGLTAAQTGEVLKALAKIAANELNRGGVMAFTIPGLIKLTVTEKPATAAGPKYFAMLKREVNVPAKPASKVVKARVLKDLKDSVV